MIEYRNRHTGQVVAREREQPRFERSERWERLTPRRAPRRPKPDTTQEEGDE